MSETPRQILVDKDLRPACYDDFHCLAENCRYSCCKGWRIAFDKKDYLSLKRQKGSAELDARMENGVRRIRKGPLAESFYGEFHMERGVCPLLREDGLCQLQMEKGHAALPSVCRVYPRTEAHMPSGCLERSLSPSCEAVLALLWDLPEGIEFRLDPLPEKERKNVTITAGSPMPLWFSAVRDWCIDLLQNRKYSLSQRIWLMGLGLKELADGKTDIRRWMERAALLPASVDPSVLRPAGDSETAMFLSSCVRILLGIQNSDPVLLPVRTQVLDALELKPHEDAGTLTIPLNPYRRASARFSEQFRGREYFMENLMVSVFFHLRMPRMTSVEELWRSYVNFCNLYAFFRFMSVMSCREGASADREELFRLMVFASRTLIHDSQRQSRLRDELFQSGSATLAHMAILLCG